MPGILRPDAGKLVYLLLGAFAVPMVLSKLRK